MNNYSNITDEELRCKIKLLTMQLEEVQGKLSRAKIQLHGRDATRQIGEADIAIAKGIKYTHTVVVRKAKNREADQRKTLHARLTEKYIYTQDWFTKGSEMRFPLQGIKDEIAQLIPVADRGYVGFHYYALRSTLTVWR